MAADNAASVIGGRSVLFRSGHGRCNRPDVAVILAASQVPRLARILTLARRATHIVRLSFGISFLYNAFGISIAAAGVLSPVICAILMPLSSVSVVLFACGATQLAAQRAGLAK